MTATVLFPFEVWTEQITQARIPANENSLRVEVLEGPALDRANAPAGGEDDGAMYIVGGVPTGDFSSFTTDNVVILKGGTWLEFAAFDGWLKSVNGSLWMYETGSGWSSFSGGGSTFPPVVSVAVSTTLGKTSHAGAFIEASDPTTPIVLTVATDASESWEDDTEIHIRQAGVALVSIVGDTGVTIQFPASQVAEIGEQYGVATLKRVAADTWALFGLLGAA